MSANPMVEVKNLEKHFTTRGLFQKNRKTVKAVDGVSFQIGKRETLGLVGESGCGKTTIARTIMRLYAPTSGQILLDGQEIGKLDRKALAPYRRRMQMVFQDPYASLDPRMTVANIVAEPLRAHQICPKNEFDERVARSLEIVGLPASHMQKYPHEFSGGQRQRIGIARALITQPEFVICDEPISALDVSIQAQVVNMLQELQEAMDLTYLFIAHDLAMVKYISNRMGVMYLGQLVELASSTELYQHPLHPYTVGLMKAIPLTDPRAAENKEEIAMEGEIPSPLAPPPGCRFSSRCKHCMKICTEQKPEWKEVGAQHFLACHLYQ